MGEIHWQPASSRARKKRIGPIGLWQEKEKCQGEEDTTNKAGSECIGHCPRHSPAHEEGICQRRRQPYYLCLCGVPFKEPENGTLHNTHTHTRKETRNRNEMVPPKRILFCGFLGFMLICRSAVQRQRIPHAFHIFLGETAKAFQAFAV